MVKEYAERAVVPVHVVHTTFPVAAFGYNADDISQAHAPGFLFHPKKHP